MTHLVDEKAVAEMLGISIPLVRKWRFFNTGGPPYVKLGRAVRYDLADVEAFLRARRVAPVGDGVKTAARRAA